MKIDNKEFLNPQQQLYENTKDIEKLKADYQPVYNSTEELYEDDTAAESVLIEDTNAPLGTKNGWILDPNGYLFKITDGSTTTLLIQYYSNIKGPQGIQGEQGEQGIQGETGETGAQGPQGQATIGIQVVAQLPASGTEGVIYLAPAEDPKTGNAYDEYIYTNSAWEKFGYVDIDLSDYIQKSSTSGLVKNDGTIDTSSYATTSQLPTNIITNIYSTGVAVRDTTNQVDYYINGVEPNPTLAGTESNLTSIDIGGTAYAIPSGGGTTVVANPTLAGTESDLTSITIGSTNYKIPNTTNMVTTDTTQTITGAKTFSAGNITIKSASSDVDYPNIRLTNYAGTNTLQIWYDGNKFDFSSIANSQGYILQTPDLASITSNKTLATTDQIGAITYTTTAPSAANTDGTLHTVVLTSEPSTYYAGYLYYITEA